MKKVIYSLYIDIPSNELDYQLPYNWDTIPKTERTKLVFAEERDRLIEVKKRYADKIGVPFVLFEYDEQYKKYHSFFKENYPEITSYNIVNFYKIHLLYELAKEYDEILYLDFDVVPVTNESFFDVWDLSKGICLFSNNDSVNRRRLKMHKIKQSVRSPTAKFYNAQAMLIEEGHSPENDVINTGIVGVNKETLEKLNYYGDFKYTLSLMKNLKENNDYNLYPENIVNMFGYDNETIMSYKIRTNDIDVQWLDNQWHYFFDTELFIPEHTKLVHAINKKFDVVWRFYEKCNL